jgi:hypothetical protein
MATSIPWDVVTLVIRSEKEVQAETVRVFVSGELLASGDDTARTKAVLAEALSKVIDAPWSLTTARRGEDRSGMERVSVSASVRVPEHRTAGLVERLKQASRAGLQLHLDRIATRPPRSEMDKVKESLRQEVYQKAKDEAERLKGVLPAEEGKWRVSAIEFVQGSDDNEHLARLMQERTVVRHPSSVGDLSEGQGDDGPDLPVSTRAVVQAKVKLKRLSIAAPRGGFFAER